MTILLLLTIIVVILILWRIQVSRTTELTNALNALAQAIADLSTRIGNLTTNVTPDADVDAAVAQLTSATDQINSLAK